MLREAAVAIIRVKSPEIRYLIVRRALNPKDPWSGHFAFPGGRREPEDSSLLDACIRETREECGVELSPENLVTALPITEAGNALGRPVRVAPFLFDLGELPEPPALQLQALECAGSHWVPESQLRDPAHFAWITPIPGNLERRFPAVRLDDGHIWGFTYKVLADLLGLTQA